MDWSGTYRLIAGLTLALLAVGAPVASAGSPPPVVELLVASRIDTDEDGQINDADAPAPGRHVVVTDNHDNELCTGTTGADGLFSCQVSPGRRTITVFQDPGFYATVPRSLDGSSARTITVSGPPGSTQVETFSSACRRDVAVEVSPVFTDYANLTAHYLVWREDVPATVGSVQLLDMGSTWTGDIVDIGVPGDIVNVYYSLTVEEGDAPQDSMIHAHRVEAGAGCQILVNFGLPEQHVLGTVLVDQDGNEQPSALDAALDDVTVELWQIRDGIGSLVGTSVSGMAGMDGQVRFEHLEPGTYIARVRSPEGWTLLSSPEVEVDVTLDRGVIGDMLFLFTESGP